MERLSDSYLEMIGIVEDDYYRAQIPPETIGEMARELLELRAEIKELKKCAVGTVEEVRWNCGDHITAPGSKKCLTCGMEDAEDVQHQGLSQAANMYARLAAAEKVLEAARHLKPNPVAKIGDLVCEGYFELVEALKAHDKACSNDDASDRL
jgi:hypothetical protein